MLLDDAAADCQSQPGASLFARVRGVNLLESFEDGLQLVFWNSPALVLDRKYYPIAFPRGAKIDAAAPGRELDRVSKQVDECLHHQLTVSHDERRAGRDRN